MKFLRSLGYAWKGLLAAFTQQRNLKIHGAVLLSVVGVGFYLRIEPLEWCALLLAAAMVLVTELVNTSIEELVNLVSPQHHPRAGVVKDIATAAVLVASFFAALVGVIIFNRYLPA